MLEEQKINSRNYDKNVQPLKELVARADQAHTRDAKNEILNEVVQIPRKDVDMFICKGKDDHVFHQPMKQ